jgi:membrane protein implicated in regulation of membrane protease activity
MELYLVWAIVGLTLVMVELTTGTFYLLVLGVAAFGAAIAAWAGQDFPVQVIVAAVVAGVGSYWVHAYRAKNAAQQMAPIDAGQLVRFENWIDQGARLARVRYRGASWDARVDGSESIPGDAVLYVTSTNGSTLSVTAKHPN